MGFSLGSILEPLGIGADKVNTTTSTSDINATTKPYLEDYLKRSQDLSNTGYTPGVTGFNGNQTGAFDMIGERARNGSELTRAGNRTMQDTISGKYLDPATNPYLQSTIDNAMGQVRGSLGGTFGGLGFGGSAHEEMMNKQSMAAAAPILMQNYQNERGLQMNATANAPAYAQNDYNDANALLSVGDRQQQLTQQQLTDEQNDPYRKLGLLGSAVNTGMAGGNNTTQTGVQKGNILSDVAGLGSAAAGAYKAFSDPSLKTNIKRIGTHKLGIGLYSWKYVAMPMDIPAEFRHLANWGGEAFGVMANEVKKILPAAITKAGKYDLVNYSMLEGV